MDFIIKKCVATYDQMSQGHLKILYDLVIAEH